MSRILLITPPLTQLNTPYPAICHLTAYLRSQGHEAHQCDLGILLVDRLYSAEVLQQLLPEKVQVFPLEILEPVKRFLRGQDLTLQHRLADAAMWESYGLPDIPSDEDLEWDYGASGEYNRAQLLCTLFLAHIGSLIRKYVSPHFELIRYGEHLCTSLPSFDPLYEELNKAPNPIDRIMLEMVEEQLQRIAPLDADAEVWISVPFPGNLYAGLRIAQYIRSHYPDVRIRMGGGYVSTELRQVQDRRIYEFVHELQYDDGERDMPFAERPAPTYDGLDLSLYMDTADTGNPMQRLWSNGRWLKLQMAHGCYWHKCTFCDTCLPYIGQYESAPAATIVDRMQTMMRETGWSGFHFVDEACPPVVIRRVSEEILRRRMFCTWWGNIRFEKSYTDEMCRLMSQAGCIAVSGGIEVASERVLGLINKGVSVASVRETLVHFRDNGIMVHAYLMFGFPTETEAELYESLATVRDLFAEGLIHSAFWHRYAMTCHSPSGQHPEQFGCYWVDERGQRTDTMPVHDFATNEIDFRDPTAPDWTRFSRGLNTATYNYMRGTGFDVPIRKWFKK